METLLTGAVNRLLRRFIKSAGGEAGSELRVSLSATGSVVGAPVGQNSKLKTQFPDATHKAHVACATPFPCAMTMFDSGMFANLDIGYQEHQSVLY